MITPFIIGSRIHSWDHMSIRLAYHNQRTQETNRRLRGRIKTVKTNEQGDKNMTTDNETRLKKEWTRRYNEMLKAGFSEAMARMEADDYVEGLQ
jgi:predicted GIY-YIG superfamily endonuclease